MIGDAPLLPLYVFMDKASFTFLPLPLLFCLKEHCFIEVPSLDMSSNKMNA
jgi:hypothetical protein